ncbi:MAG: YidC/Oxa1 family membrane protein insertase [Firmicutes bacterium]|nr:YidC/Oxa1 family membrane protein insertase [Bacillota bacterium]
MKNKILSIILVLIVLLTSGCGSNNYIKDEDNKIVQYEATGQNLQKNILCKPEGDSDLYKLYEQYNDELNISLEQLPECDEFKINSNKASGIWEFLFIKPLAYLILKLGNLVGNMGISLILVGLLIRLILLPFSYKSHKQSKDMQKVNKEIQKLELKYRGREDRDSMMMKSQEMMEIYKKHNVKPMSGCLVAFLQLPIFFAFLQAINRVPAIFEDSLLGFNLGMTPYVGLSNGNYLYIILIILIAVSTYFSFKYSMKSAGAVNQSPEMKGQMNMMTNIMVVMIVVTSFSLSTALAFYWIITYAFIAIQTYIFKRLSGETKKTFKDDKKNNNKIKDKLEVKRGLKYGNNK